MDKEENNKNSNLGISDIVDNIFLELIDDNIEYSDRGIDYFLDDDILKIIPIINGMRSLIKTGISIQNRIFAEKLFAFIKSVNKGIIHDKEKSKYLRKMEDRQYREKVGGTIFNFINNFNELEKSDLLGKLFRRYILEQYSYEMFIEFSNIVENMMISDLNLLNFLYKNRDKRYYLIGNIDIKNFTEDRKLLMFSSARRLINLNVIDSLDSILYEQIENPKDNMDEDAYFQLGGHELAIKINNLGKLFFENIENIIK